MALDPGGAGRLASRLSAVPSLGGARRVGPDHGAGGSRGGAETGLRLHRRHHREGASEGHRRAFAQTPPLSLRFNRSTGTPSEALGRSRGGLGTKIVGVCDAVGRLVDFILAPGQAHELASSPAPLKRRPEAPDWALAD